MDNVQKRILAVAFEGRRPAQASAMWNGQHLYIKELREINEDRFVWTEAIKQVVEDKVRDGWVVMLEDRTFSFPGNATSWNFDVVGDDGRTNLQSALDWYFALQGRGQIEFTDATLRFAMKLGGEQDMIYAKNDERGRLVYCVNWPAFKSAHRALLMCVAGAVMEEPLSDRWIKEFCGYRPELPGPPIWPVFRTMRNLYKSQQEELERRVLEVEARKHV